jgi:hypothetical protein
MKRLKTVLSLVGIFAFVGGIMAFQAKYNTRSVYCLPLGNYAGACPASAIVNYRPDVNGYIINPCPYQNYPHLQFVDCLNATFTTLYSPANP